MRRTITLVLATLLFLAAPSPADRVYLRDGRTLEGLVVEEGKDVVIELEFGKISVPADQVLRIIRMPVTTRPALPASLPATGPALPGKGLSPLDAARPEPVLFSYMRTLAATPSGPALASFRTQIDSWQAFAHDRKRNVDQVWVGPHEFVVRREGYQKALTEAQGFMRQMQKIRGDTDADKAERYKLETASIRAAQKAAPLWPDPLLRRFLTALAELRAGNFGRSETALKLCCQQAPRIAAFHQAYSATLFKLDHPLEGLQEAMETLRLQPDSQDALLLLQDSMKRVPGNLIKGASFLRAQEIVAQYEPPTAPLGGLTGVGSTVQRQVWLMPGRPWEVRDETLPSPPYDRLSFLQAVAVPIGKHTLLVDEAAVANAESVVIQIDEKTLALGQVLRTTSYGKTTEKPLLTTVQVNDCEFTPLEVAEEAKVAAGEQATLYALNLYEEMGGKVRQAAVKIVSVDAQGKPKLSRGLAAGEAAGPLLTKDGKLLGFLAGKTDPYVNDGGPDRLVPPKDLAAMAKRFTGSSSFSGFGSFGQYGRARKLPAAPQTADGKYFILFSAASERLEVKE